MEGQAAEVLRDFDDSPSTAVDDLWERLSHRFGDVDECREAMRKFEARRQSDTESLVEFEQALRSLFKVAWPTASSETRDATLKRRFEDGVLSSELSQYLRLHHSDFHRQRPPPPPPGLQSPGPGMGARRRIECYVCGHSVC